MERNLDTIFLLENLRYAWERALADSQTLDKENDARWPFGCYYIQRLREEGLWIEGDGSGSAGRSSGRLLVVVRT